MHFINGHGRVKTVGPTPARHPRIVIPLIIEIANNGRVLRRDFVQECERIGLIDLVAEQCSIRHEIYNGYLDISC